MLEGTDLSTAYGLVPSAGGPSMFDDDPRPVPPKQQPAPVHIKSTPIKSLPQAEQGAAAVNPIMQQVAQIQAMQQRQHAPPQQQIQQQQPQVATPQYDASSFHRQFEQEQQRMMVQDWNRRPPQQQPVYYAAPPQEPSYWDKMASKKREVLKFLQSAMIIVFALSLHVVIDFVLKHYLQMYDLPYEKELMIRILYPIGILVIAWNIITFIR